MHGIVFCILHHQFQLTKTLTRKLSMPWKHQWWRASVCCTDHCSTVPVLIYILCGQLVTMRKYEFHLISTYYWPVWMSPREDWSSWWSMWWRPCSVHSGLDLPAAPAATLFWWLPLDPTRSIIQSNQSDVPASNVTTVIKAMCEKAAPLDPLLLHYESNMHTPMPVYQTTSLGFCWAHISVEKWTAI